MKLWSSTKSNPKSTLNLIRSFGIWIQNIKATREDIIYILQNYNSFDTLVEIKILDVDLGDEFWSSLLKTWYESCPKYSNLHLINVGFGIESCKMLKSQLIHENSKFKYIDLSNNQLEDESFWEILIGLSKNTSIKGMRFAGNNITSASMKILNALLKFGKNIKFSWSFR